MWRESGWLYRNLRELHCLTINQGQSLVFRARSRGSHTGTQSDNLEICINGAFEGRSNSHAKEQNGAGDPAKEVAYRKVGEHA